MQAPQPTTRSKCNSASPTTHQLLDVLFDVPLAVPASEAIRQVVLDVLFDLNGVLVVVPASKAIRQVKSK